MERFREVCRYRSWLGLNCKGDGSDEMFFDSTSERIYVQGDEGIPVVWREVDPDHYESHANIQVEK